MISVFFSQAPVPFSGGWGANERLIRMRKTPKDQEGKGWGFYSVLWGGFKTTQDEDFLFSLGPFSGTFPTPQSLNEKNLLYTKNRNSSIPPPIITTFFFLFSMVGKR